MRYNLLLGYACVVNAGSAALFWYDKQQALNHQWRVAEKTLQMSALIGGWIGGFWAMNQFRHKTKKESFLKPYYAATAANIAGATLLLGTRTGRNLRSLANFARRGRRGFRF